MLFNALKLTSKHFEIYIQHVKILFLFRITEKKMNNPQGLQWVLGLQLWCALRVSGERQITRTPCGYDQTFNNDRYVCTCEEI